MSLRILTLVFLFLYLVGLHSSIALMEMTSWTLVALELIRKFRAREKFWFPAWQPLLGLTVAVVIGLCLNPLGRPFIDQLGFMRWIVLMYFFAWILADVWSAEFESRFLRFWIVVLCVTGAYAFLQFLTGIDIIRPAAQVVSPQGGVWRATGWFSMSLTFGYCIGFSFIAVLLPARRELSRYWGYAAFACGTLAVMSSMSRGAWIALIAAGFVYYTCQHRKLLPWFVGAVVAAVGGASLFSSTIASKIHDILYLHPDHSAMMRVHLWQAYWAIFKDHIWFGAGLDQTDLLLPDYYKRLGIDEVFASHAHDVPLQWLAGTGIIGFAFYAWVSLYFLRLAWKLRERTPWGWSLFLAQIYIHVGGLTENNFFDAEVNHGLTFGWSMLLALEYRRQNRQPLFGAPANAGQ